MKKIRVDFDDGSIKKAMHFLSVYDLIRSTYLSIYRGTQLKYADVRQALEQSGVSLKRGSKTRLIKYMIYCSFRKKSSMPLVPLAPTIIDQDSIEDPLFGILKISEWKRGRGDIFDGSATSYFIEIKERVNDKDVRSVSSFVSIKTSAPKKMSDKRKQELSKEMKIFHSKNKEL